MADEPKNPSTTDQSWRDTILSWSTEDRVWLAEKVPEALRPTAAIHGKPLYQITFSALVAQQLLSQLVQLAGGNRQILNILAQLASIQDGLCKGALKGEGKTLKEFHLCRRDAERVLALMDHGQLRPGDRVSPGGIVLDS